MPLALEPCEINLEFFERHLQDGIANLHLSEQVVDIYLTIIIGGPACAECRGDSGSAADQPMWRTRHN